MIRYVLDTNVVVAGLRSPAGASAALIDQALDRAFTLLLSVALALEYEAVCLQSGATNHVGIARGRDRKRHLRTLRGVGTRQPTVSVASAASRPSR